MMRRKSSELSRPSRPKPKTLIERYDKRMDYMEESITRHRQHAIDLKKLLEKFENDISYCALNFADSSISVTDLPYQKTFYLNVGN